MMVFQQRGYACVALGLLCSLSASCGDDEGGRSARVRNLFTAIHGAVGAACTCNPEISCGEIASYECAGGIIEGYEDEISEWIDCALPAYDQVRDCIEASDCTEQAVTDCFDQLSAEAVCEEIPDALDDRIDEEVEVACPEPIECDDGSTGRGHICNGTAECADASDEDGCGEI